MTTGQIFSNVVADRVIVGYAFIGTFENQRYLNWETGPPLVRVLQGLKGEHLPNSLADPRTWDFQRNIPNPGYTPHVMTVSVEEAWYEEAWFDALGRKTTEEAGGKWKKAFIQRFSKLSCYAVKDYIEGNVLQGIGEKHLGHQNTLRIPYEELVKVSEQVRF